MESWNGSEHKERLDVEMVKRGIVRSRSLASDLISRKKVSVNGKIFEKASAIVQPGDAISVSSPLRFASRAGEKLDHALDIFRIDVADLEILDIGSSTGGFTDCLLQRGAKKVVCVDVGRDQLAPELRADPRVEVNEGVDIRKLRTSHLFDICVVDVSFISLSLVLPKAYELLKPGGSAIALVKPQFEVGAEIAKKSKGVVRDENEHRKVIDRTKHTAKDIGFKIMSETASPIEGEKGNREFLLWLKK